MKHLTILLTAIVLGTGFNAAQAAVIYDYAADFSVASNPNGAWSYGAKHKDDQGKPTGEFVLFDVGINDWMGPHWYMSDGDSTLFGGEAWKNITGGTQYSIQSGHCSLNGDAYCTSTARWTSPVSCYIDVDIWFSSGMGSRCIMHNDTILAEGNYYNPNLWVNAGDTIDVSIYGAPYDGNTMTNIIITIPEPATIALLAIGSLAFVGKKK
jgi:hypothetical protein